MLFASDLDRTLIYSKRTVDTTRKDIKCVELYEGKPLSYMLPYVMDKLKHLPDKVIFVPTTTRSAKQFSRLKFFHKFKYAIIDNGGTILCNGKPLKSWEEYVSSELSKYVYGLEHICKLINDSQGKYLSKEAVVVDNKFIYGGVEDVEGIKSFLDWYLDKDLWYYSLYYHKLYIFPKCVEKSLAVQHLKSVLNEDFVVSAGDGDLDIQMLLSADVALTPKHGRVWRKYSALHADTIVVPEGILASEHIIDSVYALNSRY